MNRTASSRRWDRRPRYVTFWDLVAWALFTAAVVCFLLLLCILACLAS